jgi:hypothetical protein
MIGRGGDAVDPVAGVVACWMSALETLRPPFSNAMSGIGLILASWQFRAVPDKDEATF